MYLPEFLNTDGEHEHDASVSSVSITQDGPLDMGLVQDWIDDLLKNKAKDMYRMKGLLDVAHGALAMELFGLALHDVAALL